MVISAACLAILMEFLLLFTATAERCYDCDSRNHRECLEISSGSALSLGRICSNSELAINPEQDRCVKMHQLGSNVVMRSCVKQDSLAASMDNGKCSLDNNNVVTCVCSGYLCNDAAPLCRQPHWNLLVVCPFFLWLVIG